MMNGRTTILLAAALFSGAIAAAASQKSDGVGFFAGLVFSVDSKSGVVRVEEAGSDRRMSFTISSETSIVKDDQPIRLEAVRVGDPVAIEYRPSGERPAVVSLKVITSPRED